MVTELVDLCEYLKFLWKFLIFLLVFTHLLNSLMTEENKAIKIFAQLMRYGKLSKDLEAKAPPSRIFYFPKRYFTHFYLVSSMWSGFVTCIIFVYIYSDFTQGNFMFFNSMSKKETHISKLSLSIGLVMIFFQGVRRLYECLYVCKFSADASINVLHYFLGVFFYLADPITVLVGVGDMKQSEFGDLKLFHVLGAFLFITASYYQHKYALILSKLRKSNHDKRYIIPRGDLFDYVSCPHYLMEIIIYLGVLVALGFRHIAFWHVFIFVVVIHVNMASMSHKWYCNKFKGYPKSRKALIPFLY